LGTMEKAESDEDLLRRISRSDPEAVRQLYRRHGARVYSLAYHIIRDASRAEEITQDVFLKVWGKAGSFDASKAGVLTWLLRITRNRAIDLLRRERPSQPLPDDLVSLHLGPEEELVRESQAHGVRQQLAALPVPARKALTMAYFQGLTHREISHALGEPLGTVKSRIRDALLGLRKRGS